MLLIQLLSFSPLFLSLFGPQILNSFVHISETRWALPSRVLRQSPWVFVVLFCVAPAPFFVVSLFFFWEICGSSCRWVFVLFVWLYHDLPRLKPKCFIYVVQFLPLLSLSGPSLRARSATTEEKKEFLARFL